MFVRSEDGRKRRVDARKQYLFRAHHLRPYRKHDALRNGIGSVANAYEIGAHDEAVFREALRQLLRQNRLKRPLLFAQKSHSRNRVHLRRFLVYGQPASLCEHRFGFAYPRRDGALVVEVSAQPTRRPLTPLLTQEVEEAP